MITKVLLILHLHLTLFFIWWRFRHVIKAMAGIENIINIMADIENISNDDDFFGDTVDTPKERECLKSVIGSVN